MTTAPFDPSADMPTVNRISHTRLETIQNKPVSVSREQSSTSISKPRNSSTKRISRDGLSPKRLQHLERNRTAANKCRMKRKEEQNQIQNTLNVESGKREMLMVEVDSLREQAYELKNMIFTHAQCGDKKIDHQLEQMSRNVLQTTDYPLSFPSPTSSSSSYSQDLTSGDDIQIPVAEYPDEVFFDTFMNVPN